MNEEEQFVNIDLNDDNICSVCKLGTDKETLSFCHICFELNIEGVPKSDLLHTKSLRGHKDCFEKYHLIANQGCPRSKLSKSTYEEVKTILSKKINWIVQYAQNKDLDSDSECSKNPQQHLFNFRHKPEEKLLPHAGITGVSPCAQPFYHILYDLKWFCVLCCLYIFYLSVYTGKTC
uniref:Chromosome 21 open reading frame 91 n=1 Tax=Rhinopithecus roxellana TaxID=61622 RepID=A0A2K6PV13_RHIRO